MYKFSQVSKRFPGPWACSCLVWRYLCKRMWSGRVHTDWHTDDTDSLVTFQPYPGSRGTTPCTKNSRYSFKLILCPHWSEGIDRDPECGLAPNTHGGYRTQTVQYHSLPLRIHGYRDLPVASCSIQSEEVPSPQYVVQGINGLMWKRIYLPKIQGQGIYHPELEVNASFSIFLLSLDYWTWPWWFDGAVNMYHSSSTNVIFAHLTTQGDIQSSWCSFSRKNVMPVSGPR